MTTAIQYHSQPATRQDQWIVEKSGGCRGGMFVEVGAHDGVRHSNTLTLEQRFDWNGMLVEADPDLYNRARKSRPDAEVIQAAVGEFDGQTCDFVRGDSYGGLWHLMPEDWQREHMVRCNRIVPVKTVTLHSLLEACNYPSVIDYLSLDVEGAEYAILNSYFSKPRPRRFRYITVEFRYDYLLLSKLEELLYEYVLDDVRAFDACFIHHLDALIH